MLAMLLEITSTFSCWAIMPVAAMLERAHGVFLRIRRSAAALSRRFEHALDRAPLQFVVGVEQALYVP